jgi:CRP-like cAMP-binding protein
MLDRLAPLTHRLRVLVEAPLDSLQHVLMLPAGEAALPASGALILDRTGPAGVGPVAVQREPVPLSAASCRSGLSLRVLKRRMSAIIRDAESKKINSRRTG